MKRLLVLFLVTDAVLASRAFSQETVLYDGFAEIASMQRNVRDVVEVKRTPLFDNAPFLRLRKGDKLVKAKEDVSGRMGTPLADPDKVYYYLFSKGKYYQLWTDDKNGKLLLDSAFDAADNCMLFDWDFNMSNARALRELLSKNYARSLTIKQYDTIVSSIQKEFPDIQVMAQAQIAPKCCLIMTFFLGFKGCRNDFILFPANSSNAERHKKAIVFWFWGIDPYGIKARSDYGLAWDHGKLLLG